MEIKRRNEKQFYVVRFIDIPFVGIDNYVCVPNSWAIQIHHKSVVMVAYPNSEDQFHVRYRAKRKESYNEKWSFYMAEIKYESDTYEDADSWITTQHDYGLLVDIYSGMKVPDSQPLPVLNSGLRCGSRNYHLKSKKDQPTLKGKPDDTRKLQQQKPLKRAATTKPTGQLDGKRPKVNNAAQASSSGNKVNMRFGCSKSARPIVTREADAATSRDKPISSGENHHRSPSVREAEPQPNMPVLDVAESTEVISTASSFGSYVNMKFGCSKRDRSIVNREGCQTEAAAATSRDKPISSQLTVDNHDRSSSVRQAQPQPSMPILDVGEPTEVISFEQERHLHQRQSSGVSSISNRQHASNKATLSMTPVEQPQKLDQRDHRKHSQDNENSCSNFQPMITDVRSIRTADYDQAPRIDKVPYISRHLPSTQQMHDRIYREMQDKPILVPMHEPVEKTIRFTNPVRFQSSSNAEKQMRLSPTERQPSTVAQNPSQKVPHLKVKMGKSNDMTVTDPNVVLQAVHSVASASQHTPVLPHQRPSLIRQISNRQYSVDQESRQLQPLDVQDVPNRPNGSHSIAPRTSFEEVLMEASTIQHLPNLSANQPNVGVPHPYQSMSEKNVYAQQTKPRVKVSVPAVNVISSHVAHPLASSSDLPQQRQLSPNYRTMPPRSSKAQVGISVGIPDSNASLGPDVGSHHETFTDEIPDNIRNDADGSRLSDESNQPQPESKLVLEQQMLHQFSTLFIQMGSTLYYTCEMFKKLRSSVLDSACIYKKLLAIGARFNALEDSVSAASSSNEAPRGQTTERENFSNYDHHNNIVAEATQNNSRVVQAANNTRWTLKYQTLVPGLTELMAGSGVYVNNQQLIYFEQFSSDCQTLAQLVLQEVFNKNALSLCLLIHKNSQDCHYSRPPLDQHATVILLRYIMEFGSQHKWSIDFEKIVGAINRKIREFRNGCGSESAA